jgi:homogentisate 1,2-dioxygenase
VGWSRIEGPLKPRAYDLRKLEGAAGDDWLESRKPLLGNADVRLSLGTLTAPMPYALRNADADELLFVDQGSGRLETDFGPLPYAPGDYLLVPRGTLYRLCPSAPSRLLIIEAASEVTFPEKGMLGQHALFDPAVLQVPSPEEGSGLKPNTAGEYEVRVLRLGAVTQVFYPFNPFDVVGWKGTLAVQKLNVRDIRPVLSDRYHLPPSAHSTFIMRNAVVCSFLPRPLENGDPVALKVPFYHSNIDFDEVLFYHSGDFFSRAGIAPGMLTFHPQGIHHGPQQKAFERSRAATRTEEVAVMLDTKMPLKVLAPAGPTELPDYWKSWKENA